MFGERLAEVRKDHGDTQEALAKKLRVSLPTVRSWEQGRSTPSYDTLAALCKMYKVSADYLLGVVNADAQYCSNLFGGRFSEAEQEKIKEYAAFLSWRRRKNKQ